MNSRVIAALQNSFESKANRPKMYGAFELVRTCRIRRGIGCVLPPLERVLCQLYESRMVVEWHEPDARWKRVLPICLPNTIPSHTRSLLRGIPLLRPAARRRSAFPVPSRTSLKTAVKTPLKLLPACAQESTPWHLGA